jgi:hypothetical protein
MEKRPDRYFLFVNIVIQYTVNAVEKGSRRQLHRVAHHDELASARYRT